MGDSSPNDDFHFAQKVQEELNNECLTKESFMDINNGRSSNNDTENLNGHIVDPNLEYTDPNPDVHKLFTMFSKRFFWDKLGNVRIRWSAKMTQSSGMCYYWRRSGECTIALSLPLLMWRPRKDLVQTLLHEMIHAYLFVTANNQDRDAHGPEFKKHMYRINQLAGTNITIYHDFHEEVAVYRTHWWRCNGCCQHQKPFFGYVKRSMNRPPGPNDRWWKRHQQTCNGVFIKVQEPDNYQPKKSQRKGGTSLAATTIIEDDFAKTTGNSSQTENESTSLAGTSTIDDYFAKTAGSSTQSDNEVQHPGTSNTRTIQDLNLPGTSAGYTGFVPFSGTGHVLGTTEPVSSNPSTSQTGSKRMWEHDQIDDNPRKIPAIEPLEENKNTENNTSLSRSSGDSSSTNSVDMAYCPVCETSVLLSAMNSHLDNCLASSVSHEDDDRPTCLMCHVKLKSPDMSICKCCNAALESHPIHCPLCNDEMKPTDLDRHLELCFSDFFSNGNGFDGFNAEVNSS